MPQSTSSIFYASPSIISKMSISSFLSFKRLNSLRHNHIIIPYNLNFLFPAELNSKIQQGAVHKLRNADGVGGWSAKVLLLYILVRYVINKMTAKTLL